MALVQRLPHDPNAIDIAAIQRREQLKVWYRQKEAPAIERRPCWQGWLRRS